jgi:hypothetical protein
MKNVVTKKNIIIVKKTAVVHENVVKNMKNLMMKNVVLTVITMMKKIIQKIFILLHEKQKEKYCQVLIWNNLEKTKLMYFYLLIQLMNG